MHGQPHIRITFCLQERGRSKKWKALKERGTVECFREKLFYEIVTSEFSETTFQMRSVKHEVHVCNGCFPDPVYTRAGSL